MDEPISNEEINAIAEWFESLSIKEIQQLKEYYNRCLMIQKVLDVAEGNYVH